MTRSAWRSHPTAAGWSRKRAPGGWSSSPDPASHTVVAELGRPQGILVDGRQLYVVDAGAKALVAVDLEDGTGAPSPPGCRSALPPGVIPKPLKGMPPFSGPQGPFAGIAAGPDGTLYVSADADGSVLAFRQDRHDG